MTQADASRGRSCAAKPLAQHAEGGRRAQTQQPRMFACARLSIQDRRGPRFRVSSVRKLVTERSGLSHLRRLHLRVPQHQLDICVHQGPGKKHFVQAHPHLAVEREYFVWCK